MSDSAAENQAQIERPIPRRILVVEDNPDSAETLSLLLELWGHAVRVAADGPAGLVTARDFNPHLIFCDIGMPGMDGYEVARRLRSEGLLENLVLVALTGYGQPEERIRAREAGFHYHLTKPVSPDALQALIVSVEPWP